MELARNMPPVLLSSLASAVFAKKVTMETARLVMMLMSVLLVLTLAMPTLFAKTLLEVTLASALKDGPETERLAHPLTIVPLLSLLMVLALLMLLVPQPSLVSAVAVMKVSVETARLVMISMSAQLEALLAQSTPLAATP